MSHAILRVCTLAATFAVGLMHEIPGEVRAEERTTADRGALTGRFLYDGTPRAPTAVSGNLMTHTDEVHEVPSAFLIRDNNLTDESLIVGPEHGIANILVWVRSPSIPQLLENKREESTVRFVKGHLEPHVVAVVAPGELTLENGDETQTCNMNGSLNANESWNRRLQPKEKVSVKLKDAEPVPCFIRGNMQPWLSACLFVRPNSYFAMTDKQGRFKIENLPPGEWEFQVWQERCGDLKTNDWPKGRFKMKIGAGEHNLGVVKLSPALFHEPVEAVP